MDELEEVNGGREFWDYFMNRIVHYKMNYHGEKKVKITQEKDVFIW